MTDEFYMKQAIRLAKKGERWVSPNPMVGAVIVREGRILSEGYHKKFGGNHNSHHPGHTRKHTSREFHRASDKIA